MCLPVWNGGGGRLPLANTVVAVFLFQDGESPRFSNIGAMHSELVAVGTNGQLYSWKWSDPEPYRSAEVSGTSPCSWHGLGIILIM